MKRKILNWLYRVLELDRMVHHILGIKDELKRVNRNIEDIVDKAIIGTDLGYRDESQVIIIQYSRLTNAFKVIADTRSRFPTYNEFANGLRRYVTQFNAEAVVLDAHIGVSKADLIARILPDKALTEMYKEQFSEIICREVKDGPR